MISRPADKLGDKLGVDETIQVAPVQVAPINYIENLNARINAQAAVIVDHAGDYVARSFDGRQDLAFGKSYAELEDKLAALGISAERVVFSRIEEGDSAGGL